MLVGGKQSEGWFLDTGAMNHMTSSIDTFVELDHSITGKVLFADGSMVKIHGHGTVVFADKGGDHRAFTDVYFILALKRSVVSVGQLDEGWFDIGIRCGVLTMHGQYKRLLIEQNGVVKRRNETVLGMASCMLKAKQVLSTYWGEVVLTVVFILNRSFTRSIDGKTPYEAWYRRKPNVRFLRTFGCAGHVKTAHPQLKKLDDMSTPMVFMGYETGSKAMYDPVSKRQPEKEYVDDGEVLHLMVVDELATFAEAEQEDC
nr:uncharacterized protein LOC109748659 [Aegilops tauschii subsp. strangulata]